MMFYGYRDPLDYINFETCVNDIHANEDEKEEAGELNTSMGADPHSWTSGNVALWLSAYEPLTWRRWGFAVSAIVKFALENDLRAMRFAILWESVGPIGHGQLMPLVEAKSTTIL